MGGYWEHLKRVLDNVQLKILYSGCIYASMSFVKPYPLSTECEVITLAFLELFEQYANILTSDYVKFTIRYTIKLPSIHNEITYTLSNAIPMYDISGNRVSKSLLYSKISYLVHLNAEKYDRAGITDISGELPEAKFLLYKQSRISGKINSIKSKKTECRPFIVADIETILMNNVHVPYAAGFLVVNPGYYANRANKYKLKTLLRNHKLYKLKIYLSDKLLLRFRDSCTLLPSSLKSLGRTLCAELGSKGSISHADLNVSNLQVNNDNLINYFRQDIILFGGVMLKAQELNLSKYHIDIEDVMTLSSLSLKIFNQNYLDDETFPIYIPTKNQDTFIRRGYYGGHAVVRNP
ncbi:hypothetical protein OROMI_034574 [Orobanche minor]